MTQLVLYANPECHLCEEAEALLRDRPAGFTLRVADIEGDLGLTYRYALRIPVLQRTDTGAELDWPFDASALAAFLGDGA